MSRIRESFPKNLKKIPMWLPYLKTIEHLGGQKFRFTYNGGVEECELDELHSIMIYGDYGSLQTEILESIARKGIPILLHRRNVAAPIYITVPFRHTNKDVLTAQLFARMHRKRATYIVRQILKAKFYSMRWLIKPADIPRTFSIEEMRILEAKHSKKYWRRFFDSLGLRAWRRHNTAIKSALDACSKFLIGIILRWITYHHLSPFHGFLHRPTEYPGLCYDLLEPYRGEFDKVIYKVLAKVKKPDQNKSIVGMAINELKQALDEKVYTGVTRQIVTRHELLHGIVLALRAYLLGEMKRFLIPTVDKPNGGRPKKITFKLYGRHAGRTDCWKEAKQISGSYEILKK